MRKLSHWARALSIFSLLAANSAAFAAGPVYSGRWTVADEKPVFSSRGILYKTIDVAQCGKNYCGVSVGPGGACGPVLFRFLASSIKSGDPLRGHGRWGNTRLNLLIEAYDHYQSPTDAGYLSINLGNGYDFGERSGNMPKFAAGYRPLGTAHCVAR